MRWTLRVAALLFSAVVLCEARGDTKWWSVEDRRYYEPLIAGVREPHVSALALAQATRTQFSVTQQDPRRVWDIDLGAELPVFGWESKPEQGQLMPKGGFGIGLWIPIDFHMIEDFGDNSAPILNIDYRFGGMVKARYGLTRTDSLAARVFVGHESTHIGDEYSIQGLRAYPTTFERINVSWQYLDLGLLYERRTFGLLSVRGGVTASILPYKGSYYSTDLGTVTVSRVGPVTPSTNWRDPYVGLEVRREGLFRRGRNVGYGIYFSSELRWRSIYDYHKVRAGAAEDRQLSYNVIVGAKRSGSGKGLGRVSPFVRYYHGVNPHGQFRNQKNYREIGIGVRFVR